MVPLPSKVRHEVRTIESGSLNLDFRAARALGFHNLIDLQLKMVAAFVLTKPVSPSEAAMSLLEFPMFERDVNVLFMDSVPLKLRMRTLRSNSTVLHPIDKYCGRPVEFEHSAFYDYFKTFVLEFRRKCTWTSEHCSEQFNGIDASMDRESFDVDTEPSLVNKSCSCGFDKCSCAKEEECLDNFGHTLIQVCMASLSDSLTFILFTTVKGSSTTSCSNTSPFEPTQSCCLPTTNPRPTLRSAT
jgi:hypothetical protein